MDFDPAFPSRVRIALFGLVVAATSLTALAADPTPRVPVEPFFRHADYSSFKLSPSGKYVAGIIPVNGRGGLVAIDLETRKPGHVTTVNVSDIGWFEWVNDDRLVFTVLDLEVGSGEQRGSGLFTVKRDGSEFRVLVRPPTGAGQWVYRYTQFLAALHDGSDDILVVANDTVPNLLFLNQHDGTFKEIGAQSGVAFDSFGRDSWKSLLLQPVAEGE